jgi:uncharacterized protein YabN with tetrapyrrole methylase and pyrophosphatase domain
MRGRRAGRAPRGGGSIDSLARLLETLRYLRSENGCPWDREQTLADMCRYLIDEAYELQDTVRERGEEVPTLLGKLPRSLPALRRALTVQHKVASVGFEWETAAQVYAKFLEEARELKEVLPGSDPAAGADPARVEEELGDMLFSVVNLGRFLGLDPEAALETTVAKFVRRFDHVERRLRERGQTLEQATLAEMDALWEEAKRKGPDAPA